MHLGLYEATPRGQSTISHLRYIVDTYWDKGKAAPAKPHYRLAILQVLTKHNIPMSQDEIVTHISEGLIDRERSIQWPLRAIKLRQAVARQFDWLLASEFIKEV